jgi:ABC-type multidrug transport system ATPase subunit
MEEAEVLCTRIGIMAAGELKCLGTQQHLKSKYGEGFKIDVMYQSGERDKADAFITATVPEAKLSMSNEGYLSYQAPKSIKFSQVFTKIESQKRRHGIITWGISQANLEQVFLTIVKHAEGLSGDQPDGTPAGSI